MVKNPSSTILWLLVFSLLCGFDARSEAIAIIVNKANPLKTLSKSSLARIYQGRKVRWNDGTRIVVINRPITSNIRRLFYHRALQSEPSKKFYNNPTPIPFKTKVVVSDLSTKKFVTYIPNSVGYISAENIDDTVKVVMLLEGLEIRN